MKKVFNYISMLAVALTAISCVDEVFPEGTEPTSPVDAPEMSIMITLVKDNSFQVTLIPQGLSGYYSFLVDNDEPYDGITAEDIYSVAYESVAQGTVCYDENTYYTFNVPADFNTTYTVYAVASSVEGNVGELAVATVLTTDKVNPKIASSSYKENVFSVTYSEDVKFTGDNSDVVATIYATAKTSYLDKSKAMDNVSAKSVSIKGNVLSATFDNLPAGCYYTVSIADDVVVDMVGNPAKGVKSSFSYNADTDKASLSGMYGKMTNQPISYTQSDLPVMVNYNSYVTFTQKSYIEKAYSSADLTTPVTYTISHSENNKKVETTYTLTGAPYYGAVSYFAFGVKLSVAPLPGDYVTIRIPEGAWIDVYGNKNPEITVGPVLYSYNYSMDDILGEWSYNHSSMFTGAASVAKMVIKESDNPSKGNVMFTTWLGIENTALYATFDKDLGTLTIPSLYYEDLKSEVNSDGNEVYWYTYAYYSTYGKKKTGLVWTMEEAGKISSWTDYLGWYYEAYVPGEYDEPVAYDYDMFNYISYPSKSSATPSFVSNSVPSNDFVRLEKKDIRK